MQTPLLVVAAALLHLAAAAQYRLVRVTDPRSEPIADPCCLVAAPDGRIFITERKTGRVRIFDTRTGKLLAQPFATLSATYSNGERGLLGIAVAPGWPSTKRVYALQHYSSGNQFLGRIVSWDASTNVGTGRRTIMDRMPTMQAHNGGYLCFGPDDKLYFPIGDQGSQRSAQNKAPADMRGKVHRFNPDGTIPRDNPFGIGNSQFCLGIRNSFGIAFHPATGALYESENGPRTADELQLIRRGGNYGWPTELGNQNKPGFDKPMLEWTPTKAVCGLAFYRGVRYPAADLYSLWVADLKNAALLKLTLGGDPADRVLRSTSVTRMIRPTDVKLAPDGYLYAVSHVANGGLYRVEWTGQAPVLPDLSAVGTPALDNRILVSCRGRAGRRMLLTVGTRQSPIDTPFGRLEIVPAVHIDIGTLPGDGVVTRRIRIPTTRSLVGRTASFQALEYTLPIQGALTNTVDVKVQS